VEFTSHAHELLFRETIHNLGEIGYKGKLVERGYSFPDYFHRRAPLRTIPVATFSQTPPSYQTACFGILIARDANDGNGQLVKEYRALGAPYHLVVCPDRIGIWLVGKNEDLTREIKLLRADEVATYIKDHRDAWSPKEVLRAKNISAPIRPRQQDLFVDSGLIPALEDEIVERLDPILRAALKGAVASHKEATGVEPGPNDLFRLAFRMLAGKIFHDRGIPKFVALGSNPGAALLLQTVASHYGETNTRLLSKEARDAIYDRIWTKLDFRNLSIDVLTHIWANTFVTKEIREAYGIHPTPRTIAKYIVDRLPFEDFVDFQHPDRLIVEPCCGSATFLVAAMQRVRDLLPVNLTPRKRHGFFTKTLIGFERETFGVEISRLCLTLADFPNPNGWKVDDDDVFVSMKFPAALSNARVVLCNPPFESLTVSDPTRRHVLSVQKPVEILQRTLRSLHPEGMLGFVLPQQFLDGNFYKDSRKSIAERFDSVEIVSLPDSAFKPAQSDAIILLASKPKIKINGELTAVTHRRVYKADKDRFFHFHIPSREDRATKTVDAAVANFGITELGAVWSFLERNEVLGNSAAIGRGIEWNLPLTIKFREGGGRKLLVRETGNRELLVRDKWQEGYKNGLPPKARPLFSYWCPKTKYLSMKPEHEDAGSFGRPWQDAKVIMNAKRGRRGPWKISAFADLDGLVFYQTFTGVWPHDPSLVHVLAAILNSPVANAFVATHEVRDITNETLKAIPLPLLSELSKDAIEDLVRRYVAAMSNVDDLAAADKLLRQIDAAVLAAYDLPPRLERELLDYFRNAKRKTPFSFNDYFPVDFRPCFSLSDYLSDDFRSSTAEEFGRPRELPPESVMQTLHAITNADKE
jgi:hypothetical protein